MVEEQIPSEPVHKDFLISYASTDRGWAEWMAATLEAEGYQTHLEAWDCKSQMSRCCWRTLEGSIQESEYLIG